MTSARKPQTLVRFTFDPAKYVNRLVCVQDLGVVRRASALRQGMDVRFHVCMPGRSPHQLHTQDEKGERLVGRNGADDVAITPNKKARPSDRRSCFVTHSSSRSRKTFCDFCPFHRTKARVRHFVLGNSIKDTDTCLGA